MKRFLLIALAGNVLLCGCTPVLCRYKHVVLREGAAMKVIERSTESNDSQGKPLAGRKTGLPIKSTLTGNGYTVTVFTPMNSAPVVFLRAEGRNEQRLILRGPHLRRSGKLSETPPQDCRYFFAVTEATENYVEFDVFTVQGTILGHEKIGYEVVSRGYVWVLDAL